MPDSRLRRLPWWGLFVLALSACGGGEGEADLFAEAVDRFAPTFCALNAQCFQVDPAACEADVRTDLGDAEAALDDAGEARCVGCLDVKTEELQKIADAQCDPAAADEAAVFAACDLDPAVDFDGDGTTDNDDDEACAGFP
jgi:hypothetical protein